MSEIDLNTDDGFSEMMRAKEEGTSLTPPPPPEVEESPEEPVAAEEAVAPEEEVAPQGDEVIEEVNANDPRFQQGYQKALGEQSEKVGAERARAEALERRLAELESRFEEEEEDDAPQPGDTVTQDDWTKVEELYENHGGAGMMLNLSNTSPQLIDAGLAFWKAEGDPEAFLFEQRMLRAEQQYVQESQPALEAPAPDPTLAEIRMERAQQAAERKLLEEVGAEKLQALQPHVTTALESAPPRMQQMIAEDLQSGDAERTFDALKLLTTLAEPHANTDVAKVAAEQRAASSREAKKAAQVATGSSRQTGGGQSGDDLPSTREELESLPPEEHAAAAKEIMKRRLLAQETSISAGLSTDK